MADIQYDRVKHLEMTGKAIERMDKAAFSLKALSPAVLGVALVLIERKVPAWLALAAAALAVSIYWYLDAQYLGRERAFRRLYDRVRKGELDGDPYVMDVASVFGKQPVWPCLKAGAVIAVHGSTLLLLGISFIALGLPSRT